MSVLSQDFGQVLLDTAASVSNLMLIDASAITKLAPVLKSAVEGILGVKNVDLQVGVMDRFALPGHPLRPELHIGVAATAQDVKVDQLRYFDSKLMIGPDRRSSRPFEEYDFMIVLIESRQNRPDWASLTELAPFEPQFTEALRGDTHEKRRDKLNPILSEFTNAVNASSNLSKPDKDKLPKMISEDLQKRLDQIKKGGGIELRGPSGSRSIVDFDYLDYTAPSTR